MDPGYGALTVVLKCEYDVLHSLLPPGGNVNPVFDDDPLWVMPGHLFRLAWGRGLPS